jgi:pimeloyl-ACP methyl ester carboxylesterase
VAKRWEIERDGVSLSVLDFGGEGPLALLLHGLAGYAGEWDQTADWLTADHRVVAYDARGHGASTRRPGNVSPDAQVADAGFVLDRLDEGPAVLVGQSLGGVTAMLLAAERPEIAAALVMVDAAPGDGGNGRLSAEAMGEALSSWPVPFADYDAAADFFRSRFGDGAAFPWADGLEQRDDGFWPRFEVDVMAQTLGEMQEPSTWSRWQAVSCPTLVLRAEHGMIDTEVLERMRATRPAATVIELADAQHDVHLDRPQEWRQALRQFLPTGADLGRS